MKKSIKIMIGLAAIVLVAVFIFFNPVSKKNKSGFELQTANVVRDSLVNVVTATGAVQPITLIYVGTQVSGVIEKWYVDYNAKVKKGQLMAELDKRNLTATLKSAEADLATKESNYAMALRNYNRQKELWEKRSISAAAWEQAENTFDTARLALDESRAALLIAQTNLNYATITASIDGVVVSRNVEEGQTVAASFNTPTLFTIANDLTKMWVIANVDEADVGIVREGQPATFTVDAYPDDIFNGKVLQIRLNGINTNNVITYQVVVDAPNPNLKLMPQMTASVNIVTMKKDSILLLPLKALRFVPNPDLLRKMKIKVAGQMPAAPADKNTHIIWEMTDRNTIQPVQIKTGVDNGVSIEVVSGIDQNSTVVLAIQKTTKDSGRQASNPFVPQMARQATRGGSSTQEKK